MTLPDAIHGTFVIERKYPHSPKKVFAAFTDKAKKRRWQVEGEGFSIESFEMDFREGGREFSSFRYLGGPLITMDAMYQDIVADRRIVFVYSMAMEEKRMSTSLTTIELIPEGAGTLVKFTEQDAYLDGNDGRKDREEGTRGLLEMLAKELDAHP
jgi:uncharacterized protein YndB with AHSA1/START domain